ncbi:MAG TPA: class I SAM-dependent methyltransferase [Desulfonatronum sp.]|nr:class I SAM-dependent methyltransferase [Desulfonatronum sp.]
MTSDGKQPLDGAAPGSSPTDGPEAPADIETSSDDYARRFAGPVGVWMLKLQENIVTSLVAATPDASILDVGGGHGQLAAPLCARGYNVTVQGSAAVCAQRIQPLVQAETCRFVTGNILDLPCADKSFDVAFCFRLLTHCDEWRTLVRELCRVAKHRVIIDYPTSQSVNSIAPMLFSAKKKLEGNTRTWRSFTHAEIKEAFVRHGFALTGLHKQFFLPMALHRALRLAPLSALLERACRLIGLTRAYGSPVIADFHRN